MNDAADHGAERAGSDLRDRLTAALQRPGVGLVKVERREPANSTFLTGGTMTMELMEWQ